VDLSLPRELVALGEEARRVGEAAARKRPHLDDPWIAGFDREFSEELGRRGWLGMTWPAEVGGRGLSPLHRFVVTEALLMVGAPIAATWVADRQIGPTLIAHGSPAQQRRYLPPMIAGTVTWCIGMSEPDAGSDLASIRTRAIDADGGFVIEGRKIWTSFAEHADHCYLVARTGEPGRGHAGLSEFIVDLDAPGVAVRPIVDATGAAHFGELELDGVRVARDRLVGRRDESWRQLMGQLERERAGLDRLLSNRALYEDARALADRTDPRVRDEIARLETGYALGRLLVLREVLGQAPPSFSAATKVFCTEHEQRVASFATRVFGAQALLGGRAARAAMYASAYTIQGGTSAVLRNVIAERLLGLPKG